MNPSCADCRFSQPYDAFVSTLMCTATIPRHFTEFQRLPTGECKPEGLLFKGRGCPHCGAFHPPDGMCV